MNVTIRSLTAAVLAAVVSLGALLTASAGMGASSGAVTPRPAPEFAGIDTWLNSAPLSMAQLRGKVVLVDFWTFDCINCIHTLPYVQALQRKYGDKGLVVVGVHSPEYDAERKLDNLKAAVQRYGITYPVAQDNRFATWNAWNNQYWPALYLVDKQGRLVYRHLGEGKYDETEAEVRKALGI